MLHDLADGELAELADELATGSSPAFQVAYEASMHRQRRTLARVTIEDARFAHRALHYERGPQPADRKATVMSRRVEQASASPRSDALSVSRPGGVAHRALRPVGRRRDRGVGRRVVCRCHTRALRRVSGPPSIPVHRSGTGRNRALRRPRRLQAQPDTDVRRRAGALAVHRPVVLVDHQPRTAVQPWARRPAQHARGPRAGDTRRHRRGGTAPWRRARGARPADLGVPGTRPPGWGAHVPSPLLLGLGRPLHRRPRARGRRSFAVAIVRHSAAPDVPAPRTPHGDDRRQ